MAKKRIPKIEVFKAKDGGYCWRCMSTSGKEIFRASETYKSESTMKRILYKYLGHSGLLTGGTGYDNWLMVDLTTQRPAKKKEVTKHPAKVTTGKRKKK